MDDSVFGAITSIRGIIWVGPGFCALMCWIKAVRFARKSVESWLQVEIVGNLAAVPPMSNQDGELMLAGAIKIIRGKPNNELVPFPASGQPSNTS